MLNSSPALLPPPAKKSQNSGLLTFGPASTYSQQPGTPHLWKRTGLKAVVAQREHLVENLHVFVKCTKKTPKTFSPKNIAGSKCVCAN